jgi:hypothetical protein
MQIKVKCSYCEKEFTVGGEVVEVLQRDVQSNNDGKVLTVTYFNCPECSTEHIVQLDDEYSKDLLEQTTAMLRSKVLFSREGKQVTKKMKKEFKQKRALLTEYRNGLMAKYHGTMFVEEFGVEFELRCVSGLVVGGGHDGE